MADSALSLLEVDELGLDRMDRRILSFLIEKFSGGPVGIETLAMAVGEEPETVEDVYEPFLVQIGFLQRTPSGRKATALAYRHLGLTRPQRFSREPAMSSSKMGLKSSELILYASSYSWEWPSA